MDAGQRAAEPDLRVLVLCFTAGVLAVHALRVLPPLPLLSLAALPLLLRLPLRPYYAMLVLGLLLTAWQAHHRLEQRWPEARHGLEREVVGHIASLPEDKGTIDALGERRPAWRFQFQPTDPALPQVRVSWYRSAATPRAGECWQLRLRMKTPHGSFNPAGFDYEGWLFRQGIGATATVCAGQRCELPARFPVQQLRQAIVERLDGWLPGHPAAPLAAALLVGDDSRLRDADWDIFRQTGTTHLVVISGFNLGIVAGVAFFLGRWLWCLWPPLCLRLPAQKAGLLGSAVVATAYALLAGFEPPVFRALLMLLFVLAALWLHRLSQPSQVLALAWLCIVLLDPFAVLSPGLWLSFGAVGAIFYVSTRRLRAPGVLRSFVSVQLMLTLLLAPLTLYYFHGASLSGPAVNLLAVPWFALLTPLLLAAALLAALGLNLLPWVADLLEWTRAALAWAAAQPDLWLAASPPAPALLLAGAGALLLFAPRGLPLALPGLLCFVPLLAPPAQAPRDGADVAVLDVGQGLAVVIRTARHTLLYDAGPAHDEGFDAGASVVAPYLLAQGVRRLDRLLISHGDNDHAGGAAAVRRLLRVPETQDGTCRDGEQWQWDGVHFRVLHPDGGRWSDNNSSCVLRVEVGDVALLLTGDIEKGAEARLLRDHPEQLYADVLVTPHHGSRSSSTAEFIEAVQPKIVLHSAGWRHHFGHPHPAVVARYAAAGAAQFHTGRQGALELHLGADRVSPVRAHRETAARWWNAAAEPVPVEKTADRPRVP
jgi:competence protein ComEC